MISRSIGLENGSRVHYVVEKHEISPIYVGKIRLMQKSEYIKFVCFLDERFILMEKSKGGVNF